MSEIIRHNGIEYRKLERDNWRFTKRGWKYQLTKSYSTRIEIFPAAGKSDAEDEWVKLTRDGILSICEGYAWNGPSGPALDTKNFMRGSLVHDALYQLMISGDLSPEWQKAADQELRRMCLEDGMSTIRAWWVYLAVRIGGWAYL